MDITEKMDIYLQEYYGKPKWKKKKEADAKAKWMGDVLDNVKKVIPNIESPTPQDFWPTMETLYNQGKDVSYASQRAIKLYKK